MDDPQAPSVETGMLIRRPAAEVFEAFVDPAVTTRFWFTRGSGRLEAGARVQWDWEMYGVSVPVDVKAVEPGTRIAVEWPGDAGPTTIEWRLTPHSDGSTFVTITCTGGDVAKQATDLIEGFALVLAGLKALLEHGIQLNLVGDRFPAGI
jgi:uncharacterized protein YndB with AHSA1/START domain